MVLPAAERAAEIPAVPVAGMREEANPALAAAHRAAPQLGTFPQDSVQGELILTNERPGAVVLVPILAKSKNFRDGYRKSDRLSVKILIVLCISSSYSLDANASRGRARIFHAPQQKPQRPIRTSAPPRTGHLTKQISPARSTDRTNPTSNGYLEKKEVIHCNSSFQGVGQVIRADTGQFGEATSTAT